jgi:hypothetical protein
MMEPIPYEEAITTFAKRFQGHLGTAAIRKRFDDLWRAGALNINRRPDGSLTVALGSPRGSRQ